ncbi:hypothetical protein [Peribacillus simplex]|uniref:Uncharacterized protein n=2 Tax=Peribacillus simplex TaxID=1478 RepID=A0A223ELP7_9BACI|nr:hypothetical protein [Peribacillus simplex]ASS95985.1 hypothetical protein BS1321_19990 [Peribacillus simplex NBRC 15720 = DSM 1321]MEC1396435.1 hypothetical protein [Peribacillus simplex]MED3985860.1 hypothetical protein [Peribacillus simplex]MED4093359.1 hypothetical protein [Peribacillus simplex]TVX77152.1 hypothetical protein FQP34_22255 [Peribacillus simplex]
MKDENDAIVPSIHNTDLHKALHHLSEQYKVSLPELRDTIEILIQNQSSAMMQLNEDDDKSSTVEELKTAIIKNREIIKKNLQTLNRI